VQVGSNAPLLEIYRTNLPAYLDYKVNALNPGIMPTAATCLEMLSTEPMGCILLVIQEDASPGSIPIIMLIAAPSLAPISDGSTSNPPGILLANIWAELVVQPFLAMMDLGDPHCPLMSASEGFSCVTTSPTPQLYFDDAQPMFIPTGEFLSDVVILDKDKPMYRASILPKLCFPFQLLKLFICDTFDLYHKQLKKSVGLPKPFCFLQIFKHKEVADSTMQCEEAGLTNVWVNHLIPFHMAIQEQLG
jgi:hypothetical protein